MKFKLKMNEETKKSLLQNGKKYGKAAFLGAVSSVLVLVAKEVESKKKED
ncbi:hypothetical protein AB1282_04645 [Gottfriedia sp. S16(2024)]